jgi:hypothetical protein
VGSIENSIKIGGEKTKFNLLNRILNSYSLVEPIKVNDGDIRSLHQKKEKEKKKKELMMMRCSTTNGSISLLPWGRSVGRSGQVLSS